MPRSAPLIRPSDMKKMKNRKQRTTLTRKEKAFADVLIDNPKESGTGAALQTYDTTDYKTASVIAAENLAKPRVQLYLDAHIQKAKNRVVELIDSEKEDIALRASDSVLDRALGKPTQRVESHSTVVTLGLSLKDVVDSSS